VLDLWRQPTDSKNIAEMLGALDVASVMESKIAVTRFFDQQHHSVNPLRVIQ
jgi:hypothetical protein